MRKQIVQKNKLLPWFIFIVIILLLAIGYIIFITVSSTSCPPPCLPCPTIGKKFDKTNLQTNLDNLKNDSSKTFTYGGFTNVGKMPVLQPQAYFSLKFDSPPTIGIYELDTFIYTGSVKFCNLAYPNVGVPKKYGGTCPVAYTIIISKNPKNYFINFSFQYAHCSKIVDTNVGTINNIIYDIDKDNFIVDITTKQQSEGHFTIPSTNIIINLKNPSTTSTTFKESDCTTCNHCT